MENNRKVNIFIKEHSSVILGVQDLAGSIPNAGTVTHQTEAAIKAVSEVPGIGDIIALIKKSARSEINGTKGKRDMKALIKAKKMDQLFLLLRGKAQIGAHYYKQDKSWKELFRDQKNLIKMQSLYGECFTGDTLIYTEKGYTFIRDVCKGDSIYSRDEKTGKTGLKLVVDVFQTEAHTIYKIELDGECEIKTTAYHPIYVEGKGWVTAINLSEGNQVQTMGGSLCVSKIEKERYEQPIIVHNLHIEDWSSFFVSEYRMYVHNGKCLHIKGRKTGEIPRRNTKDNDEIGFCNSTKEFIILQEGTPFLKPRINDDGTFTIGYGYDFTEESDPDMFNKYLIKDEKGNISVKGKMTEKEAEDTIKLIADKKGITKGLDRFIHGEGSGNNTNTLELNQNQYDALFSYFYANGQNVFTDDKYEEWKGYGGEYASRAEARKELRDYLIQSNGSYEADTIEALLVGSKGANINYDYKSRREAEAELFNKE